MIMFLYTLVEVPNIGWILKLFSKDLPLKSSNVKSIML